MEKKIAVISCILENPQQTQHEFNDVVASFKHLMKGRMGIPFEKDNLSVVSLTVLGTMDEINAFTGKLGSIKDTQVKTAISKKSIDDK